MKNNHHGFTVTDAIQLERQLSLDFYKRGVMYMDVIYAMNRQVTLAERLGEKISAETAGKMAMAALGISTKHEKHDVPGAVSENAKKGEHIYAQFKGTLPQETLDTGRQLAKKKSMSLHAIMQIRSFFAEHAGYDVKKPGPAQAAYLLFGGAAGKQWAISVVRKHFR